MHDVDQPHHVRELVWHDRVKARGKDRRGRGDHGKPLPRFTSVEFNGGHGRQQEHAIKTAMADDLEEALQIEVTFGSLESGDAETEFGGASDGTLADASIVGIFREADGRIKINDGEANFSLRRPRRAQVPHEPCDLGIRLISHLTRDLLDSRARRTGDFGTSAQRERDGHQADIGGRGDLPQPNAGLRFGSGSFHRAADKAGYRKKRRGIMGGLRKVASGQTAPRFAASPENAFKT